MAAQTIFDGIPLSAIGTRKTGPASADKDDGRARLVAAPARLVVAARAVASAEADGAVGIVRLAFCFAVLEEMNLPGDGEGDMTGFGSLLMDGSSESFHRFRVGPSEQ